MFKLFTLSVLTGVLVGFTISSVSLWWCLAPVCFLLLSFSIRIKPIKVMMVGFCFGFLLLFIQLWLYAKWQLPLSLQKKPVTIIAQVVSVPIYENHKLSFVVKTSCFNHHKIKTQFKLNWYLYHQKIPNINPGETWRFVVKLTRPHSFKNPGGFDYFLWLLQANIHATGYVVNAKKIVVAGFGVNEVRQNIKTKLFQVLDKNSMENFIAALTVGVRQNINSNQWQVLQNTGTNHLIAIAGLHIGLVTGLIIFLISFIWKRLPFLPLFIATPRVASLIALLFAWCYAALAGFTLPTQRAVIMLTVFLGAVVLKAPIRPWFGWCLAMLIVLILNPFSVISVGFWLSFVAVAIIILLVSGRVASQNKWLRLGKIQFGLALGLLPLTLFFFGNASLVAPLANLIVIPIVGFITVPLSLLGSILMFIEHSAAQIVLHYAALSMSLAWHTLVFFSHLPYANYQISLQWPALLSVCFALCLFFLPRGIPGKQLSVIFILPLFFNKYYHLANGQVLVTTLDVGQGLAVVVQTQHHVLVYDTGARYGNDDMGKMVVIPYLQYQGIHNIDKIIISHGDNDHIGGLQSLLATYPVRAISTSVPNRIKQSTLCLAGQHWQWDNVKFKILYPNKNYLGLDNNSSCVLQVMTKSHSILLTGDIEKLAEHALVKEYGMKLKSDIIIAPHHGSKTSSSLQFLNLVKPKYVVFSTGYLNRFHFPNNNIVMRYQQLHAKMFNTAVSGAVQFKVGQQIQVHTFLDSVTLKWLRSKHE